MDCLEQIRSTCPALRLLVDEELWPKFEAWHRFYDHEACHQSILLNALENGYLARVTAPIHQFLLASESNINPNYKEDLRERWMLEADPIERHRLSKGFRGRLAELQFASWLKTEKWRDFALEALQNAHDIQASTPEGRSTAFEVKFIALQDESFGDELTSLSGSPKVSRTDPYEYLDHLTIKIYEASHQLSRARKHKVALLIVDDYCWHRFDLQIKDRWMKWNSNNISLERPAPSYMKEEENKTKYPKFPDDLDSIRKNLNEIWLFRLDSKFEFHRELTELLGLSNGLTLGVDS